LADEYEKKILQYGFSSSWENLESRYVTALEGLADVLLPGDLVDQLHERGYRKLVIVADLYLHEVPFAALRPNQDGRRAYLGLPGGGQGFQIVYAPSSSIFAHWIVRAPARTSHDRRSAALFVDPLGDLSQANPMVVSTFNSIGSNLRDRHVDVTRFDNTLATPISWINELCNHDLVVYFGHSEAGHGDAEHAALMLNDGVGALSPMSAADIYRESSRKLFSNNSLIVFASCSGGLAFSGGWDSDRELTGLSVAHLQAGCGTVIAASRPLLDSPTLVLLDSFLGRLLQGDDAATSLTEAQRELMESQTPFRHPHFWCYLGLMGAPHWRIEDELE